MIDFCVNLRRMMPMMAVTIILGHFVMIDCWGEPYTYWNGGEYMRERQLFSSGFIFFHFQCPGVSIFPNRVMSYLLFYTNYCDQITHGSFLGSLMWSCAVDLHVGAAMLVIVKLCASFYQQEGAGRDGCNKVSLTRLLRWVFALLAVVACLIRGGIFDPEKVNMVQLGQYFHFRMLQPSSSYTWMETFFGHEWQTSTSAIDKTHEYLNKMYFPTHTRFGPFMVGGVVACCLLLAQHECKEHKGKEQSKGGVWMRTIAAWVCTAMAVVQLIIPCLPAPPIGKKEGRTLIHSLRTSLN